ncbi:S41 family peptidase [Hyphococcus sp.]|uniref:S41 family peptidase n=1 Tax=Hyphococcus sp. TaxID=2038636 RepID=UPI0020845630|nr:MAG: peptidase S41 [Marinicaulis sp.]
MRTGVDIEGFPFPDMLGSTLLENFWLRSWTRETYLWNTEVVDRNPANYANRLQYFDLLRTTAKTASGKDKDEFHFSQPTADYLEQRNSAPTAGYGASYGFISSTPPRDIRIQYTEPGSPAADQVMGVTNLPRGARILQVDGVDLVNANTQAQINTLNNGLFPAAAGEMHTFVVRDDGSALDRTVMLISDDIATSSVNKVSIISTATGDVGYALINTFSPFASEADIVDAITTMDNAGVSDAILDLRYNGGGLVAVSAQLGYMIAGNAQTSGKTFEALQFNAAAGNRDPVTGEINSPVPFIKTALGFSLPNGTPLPSLNLNRVFILTTGETCSASESVINGLRGVNVNVVLIGGTTCGKPFGFYPEDNCGETYYTIQFRGVNDKDFGDYTDGFAPQNSSDAFSVKAPGCVVADDFSHELGDEAEALLAAALNYRATSSCPAVPVMSAEARIAASTSEVQIAITPPRNIMDSNRDMKLPN